MTVQRMHSSGTARRKEIVYYVAVLFGNAAVAITVGILVAPALGLAVFAALSELLLPKKAPFWRKRRY